jgi:general secretion pathway protein A
LRVAGAAGEIFTAGALGEVHRVSSGVPRVINVVCDRALLGAYTEDTKKVTPALVRRAAGEVYGRRFVPRWLGWLAAATVLAGICATVFLASGLGWQHASSMLRAAAKATPAVRLAPAASQQAAAGALPPANAPPAASGQPAVTAQPGASAQPAIPRPAPAPPRVSINALLAENAANTGDAAAFRRLLSLWGSAMTDDKDPCGQAQKAGLACLEQRGSWAQVRALNRPAILTLTDDQGQRHRVVLSALDQDSGTLDLGDRSVRVPLDELSRDWFGEFTVVWKPKTPHTRLLTVGMRGDEVRWLRRSLNALHGAASDPALDDLYDQQLAIAVQHFQREHRLNVDGVAGLQTQVVLDTALADPGSPLLTPLTPHG